MAMKSCVKQTGGSQIKTRDSTDALIRSIDKSPNSSIERPARRGESLSEVGASPKASAPELFRIRSKSCIPAAFGIENRVLRPRLDNIGATPKTQ